MALVITPKREFVTGDRLRLIVDITGDTSYPTNGSVLAPSAFGMYELDLVHVGMPPSGVRTYQYDYTNGKLKAFSAYNTEVTNTTNCSADVIRVEVIGKGFPVTGV